MKKIEKNVYVTLNSLVDIKLALALYVDPYMIKDDSIIYDYLKRKRDNIGLIPFTIIEDLFRHKLDSSLLQHSSPTPLLHNVIVEDFVLLQCEADKDNEVELNNKLIINIYPYELDDITKEYIRILGKEVLPDIEIEIVRLSIPDVTAKWIIDNHIVTFYDYYGEEWLGYHSHIGDIFDHPIKNTLFCLPKLNNSPLPLSTINDDFFNIAESAIREMVTIKYISPYFFSAFIKDFYLEDKINEIYEGDMKVNIAKQNEIIKEKNNERDFKSTSRTTNVSKW